MQKNTLPRVALAGTVCATVLFGAADFWKNKEYKEWTDDEISRMLTDSPWAKQKTTNSGRSNPGQRRGGGMGRNRGGIGFPGGGIGFPGGGYPRGGGGYPGGGGGGGYPNGGGGSPNGRDNRDDDSLGSMNLTVRWESALPVQHALLRQGRTGEEESKIAADAAQKDYVIAVFGYRFPNRRRDDDQDSDKSQRMDQLRQQFIDAAQLVPKGNRPIYAEDVQFEGEGWGAIRFLFSRGRAINAADKEVDFILDTHGSKLEHKFHLGDMQYLGQLAL